MRKTNEFPGFSGIKEPLSQINLTAAAIAAFGEVRSKGGHGSDPGYWLLFRLVCPVVWLCNSCVDFDKQVKNNVLASG